MENLDTIESPISIINIHCRKITQNPLQSTVYVLTFIIMSTFVHMLHNILKLISVKKKKKTRKTVKIFSKVNSFNKNTCIIFRRPLCFRRHRKQSPDVAGISELVKIDPQKHNLVGNTRKIRF